MSAAMTHRFRRSLAVSTSGAQPRKHFEERRPMMAFGRDVRTFCSSLTTFTWGAAALVGLSGCIDPGEPSYEEDCVAFPDSGPAPDGLDPDSPELSAVSLLWRRPKGGVGDWEQFCSGTLIGKKAVLTAKHCISSGSGDAGAEFSFGFDFSFGPDKEHLVPIDRSTPLSPDQGGFSTLGSDVGVMILEKNSGTPDWTSEVDPLTVSGLEGDRIDEEASLTAVGYYFQGSGGVDGERKTAELKLRARRGRPLQDAFQSVGRFERCAGATAEEAGDPSARTGQAIEPVASAAEALRARDAPEGGDLPERTTEEYFHSALLDGYEAWLGGGPGEAQPCHGDSGSPLVKRGADGDLRIYGVVSAAVAVHGRCAFGVSYAIFPSSTLERIGTVIADKNKSVSPIGAGHPR